MKRRAFLRTLGTAATAAVVAPLLSFAPAMPARVIPTIIATEATRMIPVRLDCLYGAAVVRPNLVCRIYA